VQQQPSIPQNEYQKSLEAGLTPPRLTSASVRYWSDFNRVYYHPRSIVQLNEYELNSSLMPFEDWTMGEDLFRDLDKEHDLLDRDIRPFAEECDQLRALQIFTGSDDAWGGFASRYVDRIRDEYGKTGIWVWALEDGSRLPRVISFYFMYT
jgi:Tubulin domain